MLFREFLHGCNPVFRQIEASSGATGWILLLVLMKIHDPALFAASVG